MDEIRCGNCRRKLGEGIFTALTIKCPRCGVLNSLRAASPSPARQGAPDPQGHHNVTVTLPGGGVIHARGQATLGQRVFIRDGVIEGPAPALTYVEGEA